VDACAADLSLVEALDLLRARKLAARELVADCLRRVEISEPRVRAFVTLTPDRAVEAARRADADRAAGREVGALAGVPVALKDVYLTRGVLTTAGSKVFATYVPDEDAAVWERLERAGAGLLGKTTTHEFAYGTASHPTANPWDPGLTSGGSSGGSAAALAARMVPAATGTDTGGSLRIPAAACGVCSLRSARGRVSRYGVIPLSPTLDVAGPLARRMLDVSVLMRVLAGFDPRDPGSHDGPVPAYPAAPPADLAGTRIGLPMAMSWARVDGDIARVCRDALELLVRRGARLVEIDAPELAGEVLRRSSGVFDVVNQLEALEIHRGLAAYRGLYTRQVRERVLTGHRITRSQYRWALSLRERWEHEWRWLLASQGLDAVAHPTIDSPPPPLNGAGEPRGPRIRLSVPWSLAGFAALSVPAGFDRRGLPVGLSLAGLPEREADLVALGVALDEEIQAWRYRPPAL
jgi:aspartyl-tRNA(Asn)/glutamyl-tRNA(Gln) amidotransferase subunit A